MNWYYHSRDPHYKQPFGAVKTGETVSLRIDGAPSALVELLLYLPNGPETLPMRWDGAAYRAAFTAPLSPCRMGYGFRINGRYFGAESGEATFADHPQTYGLTVYDGAFQTPEWFRHAVVYQIFPDRFFCSDRERFLRAARDYRATGRPIFVHDNPFEPPYYTPHGGAKAYAPDDYFGGDLPGIQAKLPYLASLGVTCIYLNPIFAAHSNHRYNTADYRSIDPLLGTNDDFSALCAAAKEYGIRIVLDGVFSHTGDDSIYFDRYGRYKTNGACESKDSPYYPWYRFYDYPKTYECWWNFETLPDVEETEPSYTEFIQGENGVLRTWMKAGASGWRLDVADELPDSFIRGVRRSIKDFDPDAVLIGEVWDNCATKFGPEGRRGYVNGDELDSVMNYGFTNAVADFLSGKTDAYTLSHALQTQREQYPAPFYAAALNLISSHDIPRAATVYAGAPDRSELTREQQAVYKPSKEKLAYGFKCMRLASVLQAAVPGVPCIYYGDEAGMTGMADPFNRETYPWGREDLILLNDLRAIFHTRSESSAMQSGKCRMGAVNADVFCVIRYDEHETVIACVNRSSAAQTVSLSEDSFPEGPDGGDRLSVSGTYTSVQNEQIEIGDAVPLTVPPVSAVILTRKS